MIAENRLGAVDAFRTIAIWIMIVANSSPYALDADMGTAYRLICSLAAPLFVFLSGYALFISQSKHQKPSYSNGFYILLSAVLVDLLSWQIWPFHTFDVLYLIGFAWLINSFLYQANTKQLGLVILLIVGLSIALSPYWQYQFENPDIKLNSIQQFNFLWFDFKRAIWDGWFPLLPWLAVSVAGLLCAKYHTQRISFASWRLAISGIAFISLFIWITLTEANKPMREGYIEWFYPVSLSFMLLIAALFLFVSEAIVYSKQKAQTIQAWQLLGQHSLFVYILHTLIISKIIAHYFEGLSIISFAGLMLSFVATMYGLVWLKRQIEAMALYPKLPKPLLKVFGFSVR